MAPESSAESGKKFARDMRRIREMRGMTVDDLHHETKIPIGLLEAFEETALFDHAQFNRVYLRSFVRTYANVLGVEPEVALVALEEALSDRYTGSLAGAYLGEEAGAGSAAEEPPPAPEAELPTIAEEAVEADDRPEKPTTKEQLADREPAADDRRTRADEPDAHDGAARPSDEGLRRESRSERPSVEDDERTSPSGRRVTGATSAGRGGRREQLTDQGDEDWTAQSPPRARTSPGRTGSRDRRAGSDWRWIGALAGVVVVAAVVWIVIGLSGNGDTVAEQLPSALDTTATVDTTMVEDTTMASRAVMPTLGDTMNVQVVAAYDKVDPIRVTVDDDLRRPYWLDQGDSITFRPTNRIVLEELLDNIELSIEGAEYPTNRRDEVGRIVITRDSIRAYFRSNGAE